MIKPDVIMCWPRNCDYPKFREYLRVNRERFDKIIVVFTESNQGHDLKSFLRDSMIVDNIICIDPLPLNPGEDWRNIQIHQALLHCTNPWVLFIEQDFTMNDGFWEKVEKMNEQGYDAIGVLDRVRIHPCFLLMKREAIERTRQDFGIVVDKLDHFGLIQKDIETASNNIKFGAIPEKFYHHMNGLSQNMYLLSIGDVPNWQPEEFRIYMKSCLEANVPQDPRFIELAEKA